MTHLDAEDVAAVEAKAREIYESTLDPVAARFEFEGSPPHSETAGLPMVLLLGNGESRRYSSGAGAFGSPGSAGPPAAGVSFDDQIFMMTFSWILIAAPTHASKTAAASTMLSRSRESPLPTASPM